MSAAALVPPAPEGTEYLHLEKFGHEPFSLFMIL